jgi:hypothetical protein
MLTVTVDVHVAITIVISIRANVGTDSRSTITTIA